MRYLFCSSLHRINKVHVCTTAYCIFPQELSEFKRNDNHYNAHFTSHHGKHHERNIQHTNSVASTGRPSGRHRRHVDSSISSRMPNANTSERKPKKRRTLERIGASVVSFSADYSLLVMIFSVFLYITVFYQLFYKSNSIKTWKYKSQFLFETITPILGADCVQCKV